jgi:Holliday junction resolvase
MSSKQKVKGSSWERDVAEFLTETYNTPFMRAPGSGAFIGGTNQSRKVKMSDEQIRSFKGDIIPGPEFTHLNIECKSYKAFPFHSLLLSQKIKLLDNWIDQCVAVADQDDLNMLIMKFNRQGQYIAVQNNEKYTIPVNSIEYHSANHGTWIFSEMKNFIEKNKEIIKQLSKKI